MTQIISDSSDSKSWTIWELSGVFLVYHPFYPCLLETTSKEMFPSILVDAQLTSREISNRKTFAIVVFFLCVVYINAESRLSPLARCTVFVCSLWPGVAYIVCRTDPLLKSRLWRKRLCWASKISRNSQTRLAVRPCYLYVWLAHGEWSMLSVWSWLQNDVCSGAAVSIIHRAM